MWSSSREDWSFLGREVDWTLRLQRLCVAFVSLSLMQFSFGFPGLSTESLLCYLGPSPWHFSNWVLYLWRLIKTLLCFTDVFSLVFSAQPHWALGIGRYTGAEGVEENGWVYARNLPKYLHQSVKLCLILPAGRNSWVHKCHCWVLFIQAPLWKFFAKQIH